MLQLLGTFLPLYGIILTAIGFASVKSPMWKGIVLVIGPLLTLVVCYFAANSVMEDGNLLAAVIFTVYFVSLYLYYPALLVVWIVRKRRKAKQKTTVVHNLKP